MADIKTKALLQEFLEIFEQIPSDITSALLKVTDDEDEKNIINSFVPTLNNQFKELSLHIQERSVKSTLQNNSEVEKFLKISSGVSLAKSLKTALPSIGSIIGKLGIAGIVHEIKKLITAILDLFGIKPKWLEPLFLIIDEIFNDIFGGTSQKMKNLLSQAEQNFLAERRQMVLLQKASECLNDENEDEV
jgi:hypothetical protein